MLESYDGKLSSTVLRREGSCEAPDLSGLRHEVAYVNVKEVCIYKHNLLNLACSCKTLEQHAAFALMKGCEACLTMYQDGRES